MIVWFILCILELEDMIINVRGVVLKFLLNVGM